MLQQREVRQTDIKVQYSQLRTLKLKKVLAAPKKKQHLDFGMKATRKKKKNSGLLIQCHGGQREEEQQFSGSEWKGQPHQELCLLEICFRTYVIFKRQKTVIIRHQLMFSGTDQSKCSTPKGRTKS